MRRDRELVGRPRLAPYRSTATKNTSGSERWKLPARINSDKEHERATSSSASGYNMVVTLGVAAERAHVRQPHAAGVARPHLTRVIHHGGRVTRPPSS